MKRYIPDFYISRLNLGWEWHWFSFPWGSYALRISVGVYSLILDWSFFGPDRTEEFLGARV